MKVLKLIVIITSLTFVPFVGFTQTGPPDPPGHGISLDQVAGGSAPVSGGLFILLGLGALYSGKKLYNNHKESLEE